MPRTPSLPRTLAITLSWAALLLLLLGSLVVLGQFLGIPSVWASLAALAAGATAVALLRLRVAVMISVTLFSTAAIAYLAHQPSHNRDWIPEVARLPKTTVSGDTLVVENLRDFNWRSTSDFDEQWIRETYDLEQLETLDVIVVPFGDSELAAHVLLSFGFEDGRHLAISVESRPERGESYSLIGGATRQLELIYLFGTERDILGLRILHRGDRMFAFPLKVSSNFKRRLLLELCESANQLEREAKFYATLRHNCTTTLLRHVNRLDGEKLSFAKEILFPAKLGELLHRLGYLDTDLDWPTARESFRVDTRVRKSKQLEPFSGVLRGETLPDTPL